MIMSNYAPCDTPAIIFVQGNHQVAFHDTEGKDFVDDSGFSKLILDSNPCGLYLHYGQ